MFEIYAAFIKLSLMKKILIIVFSFFLFSSCDDGELTLESFNFENQTIQKCTDNYLLFKTKNDELLLLNIPEGVYNTLFASSPTNGTPREATIGGTNEIFYRKYSGNVSNATVCALVPVSTPTVTKEWKNQIQKNPIFQTLDNCQAIDFVTYEKLHKKEQEIAVRNPKNEWVLDRIEKEIPNLIGARYYKWID